jgi:hypothetical protein
MFRPFLIQAINGRRHRYFAGPTPECHEGTAVLVLKSGLAKVSGVPE